MVGQSRWVWYVRTRGMWRLRTQKESISHSKLYGAENACLVVKCAPGCGCNVLSLNFARRRERGGSRILTARVTNFCPMKK